VFEREVDVSPGVLVRWRAEVVLGVEVEIAHSPFLDFRRCVCTAMAFGWGQRDG
jgi:hypothetical protein